VIAQQKAATPPQTVKTSSLSSFYSSPLPQRRMDGAVRTPLEQRASFPSPLIFNSNNPNTQEGPYPSSFQGIPVATSPFKALFGSGSIQRRDNTPTQFIQEEPIAIQNQQQQEQNSLQYSNPKETIWTPLTSLFSSNILNQDHQEQQASEIVQQGSDSSENVDFDFGYDGSGPTHHHHNHDDHSSYTTTYTSPTKVSHSTHSTFLDGALLGPSPIIHSSSYSSPWAPPKPLKVIKYFKDSVNSFRFTPYVVSSLTLVNIIRFFIFISGQGSSQFLLSRGQHTGRYIWWGLGGSESN
jgi:hypothetical protein